ncbi:DUF885 family protein, partial [Terriglobus sp. YAF25]
MPTIAVVVFSCFCLQTRAATPQAAEPKLPSMIQQFSADRRALEAAYVISFSASRLDRMEAFYQQKQKELAAVDFKTLAEDEKLDYLLLQNQLRGELYELGLQREKATAMRPLLPFAGTIEDLEDKHRRMVRPDAEKTAATLMAMVRAIENAKHALDPAKSEGKPKFDAVVANRAVAATEQLKKVLHNWYGQYSGYDPGFTWWVEQPYRDADKALEEYEAFLREKLVGIAADDKKTIIGDPVGHEALMRELSADLIPYTPEELTAIAQTEYDWCMKEMLRASHEMGYGDDWHAAVEKVKTMHVPPGDQPELIRKLVVEGIE